MSLRYALRWFAIVTNGCVACFALWMAFLIVIADRDASLTQKAGVALVPLAPLSAVIVLISDKRRPGL